MMYLAFGMHTSQPECHTTQRSKAKRVAYSSDHAHAQTSLSFVEQPDKAAQHAPHTPLYIENMLMQWRSDNNASRLDWTVLRLSCIFAEDHPNSLKKRKDCASQVRLHALRKGSLTGKPARASPKFAYGRELSRSCCMVYGLLDEEFKQGLHALSMKLKTPEEAN
eukprot:1151612-Pelagomonas_calceolata.AAC.1